MTKKVKITAADFGLPEDESEKPKSNDVYELPLYNIYSNPVVNLNDIYFRRFSIFDSQGIARQEIQSEEDRAIFEALDRAPFDNYSTGAAIADPIRRNVDYQAMGRRIFSIESMPENATPIYFRTDAEYRREYEAEWPPVSVDYYDGYSTRRRII